MRPIVPAALLFLLASGFVAPRGTAEVLDAAAVGFTVRHEADIAVGRDRAYALFARDIGQWWNPDHTVSGNAALLTLDARPMGCFCELTGDGSGVVHMIVTLATAPSMLRLTGGLGPLGLAGASGNLTVEFLEFDGGTRVVMQYAVGGYHPDGLDALAPSVDAVLAEAMRRYHAHSTAQAGEQ